MGQRRILFGVKAGWNEAIASVIDSDRFDCDVLHFGMAKDDDYAAVVPLTLEQQAELRARLGGFDGRFLIPDAETETRCHDKLRFNRFLAANGLGDLVPRMWRPHAARPPFVLKRRRDEYGSRSHVIADEASLAIAAPLLDDTSYFAQALVEGENEHTAHVLAIDGVVVHQLHVAYVMPGPACIRGQREKPSGSRVLTEAPVAGLIERVVDVLGYTGLGCLNYKITPDGRPQVFEFNPRFGSSLTRDVNAVLDAYLGALDAREGRVPGLRETAV